MAEYVIARIESKREKVNHWHERITGKRCTIEILNLNECAYLEVWGCVEHQYRGMPIRYRTSPVVAIVEHAGVLAIETENSTYFLELAYDLHL